MRLNLRAVPVLAAIVAAAAIQADIKGPTPLAWRWAESARVSPSGTPQFVGENVIVAVGGRIYSLDKSTGNLNWRFPAGEPIPGSFTNGVVVVNGIAVAGSDDKSVFAVNAETGEQLWQYVSPDPITSNVAVAGDAVGFVGGGRKFNVLGIQDGQLRGQVTEESELIYSDIDSYQSNFIYTTQRGKMVAVNSTTVQRSWEQKFNSLSPRKSFAIYNDRIYVNSQVFLIALRAASGSVIFQENTGQQLYGAPAAGEPGIASLTQRGGLLLFNSNGRAMYGKPVEVGVPVNSPSYLGNVINVSTANGAINLVDPASATVVWSYVISPIVVRKPETTPSTGTGGSLGGDAGIGTPGAPGTSQTQTQEAPDYTLVAGQPAVSGNSLFVLTRDASLLMFDAELGVDLTPPTTELRWPIPGQEMSGRAPFELVFKLEDLGIGIDPDSVKVTINGKEYVTRLSNDGFLSVIVINGGANAPLADGRAKIVVQASDWLGNQSSTEFNLRIDNTLPALGGPPRGTSNSNSNSGTRGPGGGGVRGDGK